MKLNVVPLYGLMLVYSISVSEGEYCFRRYKDRKGGFCKGIIKWKPTDETQDSEACCSKGGAGYAMTKVRRFKGRNGRVRNAFKCIRCPVDKPTTLPPAARWSDWGDWGSCSRTCQAGYQERRRTCSRGTECKDSAVQIKPCTMRQHCPIDGAWGPWFPWQPCSKSCAGGMQKRQRSCTNPRPMFDGLDCLGDDTRFQPCNEQRCPIHGEWGSWSSYSKCSKSCGRGKETSRRFCVNPKPQYGGDKCEGKSKKTKRCMIRKCPVHGGWSLWGDYSPCTISCGVGTQTRSRTCDSPRPRYGGNRCSGASTAVKKCFHKRPCPIDGGWSKWSKYGDCLSENSNCTGGVNWQTRSRRCNNPRPLYGGKYCDGDQLDTQKCQHAVDCPLHGGWCEWGKYNECSLTCGTDSYSRRFRECKCPEPKRGGSQCKGGPFSDTKCTGLPPCPKQPDVVGSGDGSSQRAGDGSKVETDQEDGIAGSGSGSKP